MSELARADADRNVLFGILALQLDFITREQLVAAMNAWVVAKDRPLSELLRAQGALGDDELALMEALVARHLEKHDGDLEKSLQAVAVPDDPALQATLPTVPSSQGRALPAEQHARLGPPQASAEPRFRVLRPHARGGLGEVFVARDEELGREVALKEIQARHADDPDSRARFVLEAEVTGGLEHPGIVPVYGLGYYADGRPYYAMRFIQGDSLKEAIARFHKVEGKGRDRGKRAAALRQLVRRFFDVCNALEYAHQRGVLHRDLKPGNIMLGKYGETLIVDWGLAKPLGRPERADGAEGSVLPLQPAASGSAPTQMGAVLGTPAYMSPEQAGGQLDQLGPASDVYSLGATLYSLLTGRPPVEGGDMIGLLGRVRMGKFPRPREVKPWVPPALEAICLKAMALRPQDRYATVAELGQDIERWLDDQPVRAWAEPWRARAWRWARHHEPLVAASIATVLVTAVCLGVATVLLTAANRDEQAARAAAVKSEQEAVRQEGLAQKERDRAEAEAREARRQRDAADQARDAAELLAYRGQLSQAEGALRAGQPGVAGLILDKTRWELRDWAYGCLRRQADGGALTLRAHTGQIYAIAYRPDGRGFASASADGTLKLWDARTGSCLQTLRGHANRVRAVAYRPDSTFLASGADDGTVRIWDAETGALLHTLTGHKGGVNAVAFHPDGRQLASGGDGGAIRLWDARTGDLLRKLKIHPNVWALDFSPDGTRLASAAGDGRLMLWDLATGETQSTISAHSAVINAVAFSPDGTRLATGAADDTARVWDAATGRRLLALEGHRDVVTDLRFHPDGTRLATASADGSIRTWDARTGTLLRTQRGHSDAVNAICYSPDGLRLLSASYDGNLKCADPDAEGSFLALRGHTDTINVVSFSPDGTRLATASDDGTARLWDPATGEELLKLHGHTAGFNTVEFGPDGRLLTASDDHTVKLWDALGQCVRTFRGNGKVKGALFSPDGARLSAVTSAGTLHLWETATGRQLFTLSKRAEWAAEAPFSPDGRLLATVSSENAIEFYDARRGNLLLATPEQVEEIRSIRFSQDGARLASASADNTVKVWDVASGACLLELREHISAANAVLFFPDDRRLISGSADGTLKVWDARSGDCLLTLPNESAIVIGLALSRDGRRLAVASGTGADVVRVWDASHENEVRSWRDVPPLHGLSFSADSRRLQARTEDGRALSWELPAGRSWEGRAATAGRHPVSPDGRFEARYEDGRLRLLARTRFLPPGDAWAEEDARRQAAAAARHKQAQQEAEQAGDWFAAAFHLVKRAELTPWDAAPHWHAAHLWTRAGQPYRAALHAAWAAWHAPELARPAPGTAVFRAAHDLDLPTLRTWVAGLPPGFRLAWLSTCAGAATPRFNAVALRDAAADCRFAVIEPFASAHDAATRKGLKSDGYRAYLGCFFADAGRHGEVTAWVRKSKGTGFINIYGSRAAIETKIKEAAERGLRPHYFSMMLQGDELTYRLICEPAGAAAWRHDLDLSLDDLRARLAEYRSKGWRADVLTAYHDGQHVRFAAVWVEDRARAWDCALDLTAAAYEEALAERWQHGLRPRAVTSYLDGAEVRYAVLWQAQGGP